MPQIYFLMVITPALRTQSLIVGHVKTVHQFVFMTCSFLEMSQSTY